jgi:hypothetical protein
LSNDRFPNTLAELDQENIKGLNVDWFTGKPLQYVKLPGGYVLYSLGADEVDSTLDSSGIEIPADDNTYTGDVVLRVKR